MRRFAFTALALFAVLLGAASAQPAPNDPVSIAYRDYRAALASGDAAAAVAAADRAWQASETRDGDGGSTAALAFNAATARLASTQKAQAFEPARRADALAQNGARGVDAFDARLLLGEALAATGRDPEYREARTLLPPTLETALSRSPETQGRAYFAANELGRQALTRGDWDTALSAFESAFPFAAAASNHPDIERAHALVGRGIALAMRHRDREAIESLSQAASRLAPFAPERDDDQTNVNEYYYARALAWSAAVQARAQERNGIPRESASLPGRPPVCAVQPSVRPMPRYPSGALMNSGVGAAIVRLHTDSEGRVLSAHVLASAPSEDFAEVLNSQRLRWFVERRPDALPGCRLDSKDLLVPVMFAMALP